MPRRVAVVGIGPVTPVGTGVEGFWKSLTEGVSGVGALSRFDTSDFPVRISAEVTDLDLDRYLDPKRARRMERFTQLAYVAARLALEDAGLDPTDPEPGRTGVVIGTGIGGIALFEQEHSSMIQKGPRWVNPALIAVMIPNAAAGALAMEFGYTGPNECTVTACASGGHAIARAYDLIVSGAADVVLAGGTEAAITPLSLASFCSASALSTRNDEPEAASRPFDRDRDGFVFGEGATVLVLENLDSARSRGARILAEITGYGSSSDAHHIVAPHPEGAGAAAAMETALRNSRIMASEVGYVNAHATSTPLGDLAEVRAIKKVFGANPPPVSSTKSMTGHLLGAAGSTEAAAAILAIEHGVLPPTINQQNPDPECDIDTVPNRARAAKTDVAMSNSFGFGGHNVSLVFTRAR